MSLLEVESTVRVDVIAGIKAQLYEYRFTPVGLWKAANTEVLVGSIPIPARWGWSKLVGMREAPEVDGQYWIPKKYASRLMGRLENPPTTPSVEILGPLFTKQTSIRSKTGEIQVGRWWTRKYVGEFLPAVDASNESLQQFLSAHGWL